MSYFRLSGDTSPGGVQRQFISIQDEINAKERRLAVLEGAVPAAGVLPDNVERWVKYTTAFDTPSLVSHVSVDTGGQRRNRAALCCADVLYWWANNKCRGQSFNTDCGRKFSYVVVYFWLVFVHHLQRDGTRKSCKERADRCWLCANAGRV